MQKSLEGGRVNMVKNVMQTRLHNHMVIYYLWPISVNFNRLGIDGSFYNNHLGKNVNYIWFVEVRRMGFWICEQNLVVVFSIKKIPQALHLINSVLVKAIELPIYTGPKLN